MKYTLYSREAKEGRSKRHKGEILDSLPGSQEGNQITHQESATAELNKETPQLDPPEKEAVTKDNADSLILNR